MMNGVRRFVIGIACAKCCACAVYDSSLLAAAKDGVTGAAGGGGIANASGYAGSGSGASGGASLTDAGGESGGTAGRPSAGGGGYGGVFDGGAGGAGSASIGGGGMSGMSGMSGSGGSGGSGGVSTCGAHPLTTAASWTATASSWGADDLPPHAIDGDASDRWSTGKLQSSTDWFQLDFGGTVSIDQVTLMLGSNALDYPRAYAVRFSNVANDLSAPMLLMGAGQPDTDSVLNFASAV